MRQHKARFASLSVVAMMFAVGCGAGESDPRPPDAAAPERNIVQGGQQNAEGAIPKGAYVVETEVLSPGLERALVSRDGEHFATFAGSPGMALAVIEKIAEDGKSGTADVGLMPPEPTNQDEVLAMAQAYTDAKRRPADDLAALEAVAPAIPTEPDSAATAPDIVPSSSQGEGRVTIVQAHHSVPGTLPGQPELPVPSDAVIFCYYLLMEECVSSPAPTVLQGAGTEASTPLTSPEELPSSRLPAASLAESQVAYMGSQGGTGAIFWSGCATINARGTYWHGCIQRRTVDDRDPSYYYIGDQSQASGHGSWWSSLTGGTSDHRYAGSSNVISWAPGSTMYPSGSCSTSTIELGYNGTGLSNTFQVCKQRVQPTIAASRFFTHWGGRVGGSPVVETATENFVKVPNGYKSGLGYWVSRSWDAW